MIYKRKYLQFNNLVFDGYDIIRDADGGASFKQSSNAYTGRHGDYTAFKSSSMYAESTSVSMTVRFNLKKILCEMREYYAGWLKQEFAKQGKLWAIQDNQIVWAYAYVSNINPVYGNEKFVLEYDIDFTLYEGVWHKADKYKTFLVNNDPCSYMLCEGYQPQKPCDANNCCTDCYKINDPRDCCCAECSEATKENSLCYMKGSLQDFFKRCQGGYKLVYDCKKGQALFGDIYLGEKVCTEDSCDTVIAGQFYSDTDIPTDGVTIHLTGGFNGTIIDPSITINGNTNQIKGEYEGTLTILPNGDVINETDCCETTLDPSVWQIGNNNYGWEVHKGNNSLIVQSCCGLVCAYVEVDALTY